jgi:hypothetical protein
MKLKNVVFCAAMGIVTGVPVVAAETGIPTESMGAIGTFAAYEKFRIFSEICSELNPESKAEFDAVMLAFGERMKRLGAEVLATDEFSAMKTQAVSGSLVNAFEKEFENTRSMHRARAPNFEGCKGAHENFKSAPDSHWKAGIASALTELRETGRPFAPAPHN